MIDFSESNYGDIGSALCRLKTPAEAAEFWHAYIAHLERPDAELLGKSAEDVARSNIGYLMGYYGTEDRQRVYELFSEFSVSHPILGSNIDPTPSEAAAAGARAMREGT